ncbi:hypothetical protein LCM20_02665 [Halobacillus litoralis]|uniref:hypothetical protein n=1 Tax=Halobacillus litoralis TaxID=45668 RepID=UPI001CD70132|nr:hypothetical protein [Halobacillus litoralis]MCA0969493.1 hypothetical protein [Halobacillus litoralis]
MKDNRDVDIEKEDRDIEIKEKKSDSSQVGVAAIKYITYLIIFFGILWFLINYVIGNFL